MRKLTRSNKVSEISIIWSVVLVSIDRAAAAASPALRPDEDEFWFNFNFPVGFLSVSRRISFLSHFNFAFCSISHSIFRSTFRSTFRFLSVSCRFPVSSHSLPISTSHSVLYSILYSSDQTRPDQLGYSGPVRRVLKPWTGISLNTGGW